jgi:hypothetical protein
LRGERRVRFRQLNKAEAGGKPLKGKASPGLPFGFTSFHSISIRFPDSLLSNDLRPIPPGLLPTLPEAVNTTKRDSSFSAAGQAARRFRLSKIT